MGIEVRIGGAFFEWIEYRGFVLGRDRCGDKVFRFLGYVLASGVWVRF